MAAIPHVPSSLDAFPPALQLLLRDMRTWSTSAGANAVGESHKRIMRLIKDLRQQSMVTIEQHLDALSSDEPRTSSNDGFVWYLPPDVDPLTDDYKCAAPTCRIRTTRQVAKLLALYADTAYVPDRISHRLAMTDKWTERDSLWLLWQLSIIYELAPLISAGILRFSTPTLARCENCHRELNRRISEASEALVKEESARIVSERVGDIIATDVRAIDPTAPIYRRRIRPAEGKLLSSRKRGALQEIGRRRYKSILSAQTYETLFGTSATRGFGTVTITGSQINSRMLGRLQGIESSNNSFWEAARATDLPWIRDLTLTQALSVRGEAASALPRFRLRMGRAFSAPHDARTEEVAKAIGDLHDEALEVQNEIGAVGAGRERRFQAMLGNVSIVAGVCGALGGAAAGAAAGLVSVLMHLHKTSREDQRSLSQLQSRPGFVLLKSQEILGHAPE